MKSGVLRSAVILVLGAVIGTLLGQIVGLLMPAGRLRDLFFQGASIGLKQPLHLDLAALQLVFGMTLTANPLTLVGLLLAIFLVVKFAK